MSKQLNIENDENNTPSTTKTKNRDLVYMLLKDYDTSQCEDSDTEDWEFIGDELWDYTIDDKKGTSNEI